MPPPLRVRCSSWSHNRQTTIPWRNETAGGFPPVIPFAPMLPGNSPRTAAEKGFQQENGRRLGLLLSTPRPSVSQTSVTSTPIFFSGRRSDLGMPWSVMTSCKAAGGMIIDKLLRPTCWSRTYLAFLHLGSGGGRNPQLFLAMQLLLLPQGRVFKRALAGR